MRARITCWATLTRTRNDSKFPNEVKVKRRGARRAGGLGGERREMAASKAAATPVNTALITALSALSIR